MNRRTLVPAVAALVLLVSACSDDGSVLESDARTPDDQGIATDVTLERIEIDGERTYDIHPGVESFATRSHEPMPLLSWKGKYVHVGLDGEAARWIAGIGLVIGKPPVVRYSGIFGEFDASERRATFEDGTILEFARGVRPPATGTEIVVEIDANKDVVVRLLN